MGLIKAIDKPLTLDGIGISITTDKEVYHQNDEVTGKIIMTTGEYCRSGMSLKVELREFWPVTVHTAAGGAIVPEFQTRQEVDVARKISAQPHARQDHPFTIRLPRNCRVSTDDSGWCLRVTLGIPFAVDLTEKKEIRVRPAEEFLGIVEAIQSGLNFQEKIGNRHWICLEEPISRPGFTTPSGRPDGKMHFLFLPPREIASTLRYLKLVVQQAEARSVTGRLLLVMNTKSLPKRLRYLLFGYHAKAMLQLSYDQIFSASGEANEQAIKETIRTCIAKACGKIADREMRFFLAQ